MNAPIDVSTVTPVYSGEKYLPALVEALAEVRAAWSSEGAPVALAESIFVVDAAIDGSEAVLRDLAGRHPFVRVVTLSRNFGQHPATMAGVAHSSGDWTVTLDEDLQHHPRHIGVMLERAVMDGLDVVYARAEGAVHQSALRDLGSRLYKAFMVRVTGNPHIVKFNSFRLMRGAIARAAASVSSRDTYYDIAIVWFTNRIESLVLPLKDVRYIESGRSGYDLGRLLSHARRMMVSSETKVLRLAAAIGALAIAVCLASAGRALYLKLADPESIQVQGWTSLFITLLLLGGLTILLLSVVVEYLTIVLLHSQGKPAFFVVDRSQDERVRAWFAARSANARTDSA